MAELEELEDVVVDQDEGAEVEAEVEEEVASEVEEATAEADAAQAAHEQRVKTWAERFASLVAKGERVMAALDAKADAADATFEKKAAAADGRVSTIAETLQARAEEACTQFVADLEQIAQAVDEAAGEVVDAEIVAEAAPNFTEAARAYRERMGIGETSELMESDPEFVERFSNFAFDEVVADVDLPDRTRFMCWLATALGAGGIDEFRTLVPAAMSMGVEPVTIKEIVYQGAAYLGISRVYPFLKAANEAFVAAGIELPLEPQATTAATAESRRSGGEEAQVACFGEHMRGYFERGNAEYPWINQWLVKNCFGDWYTRGGLTIPERELMTFCYIAAQGGCEAQLRGHTAANVQCGNDREFLIKVVSNNVPFIGYPRSLNALAVVEEVTGSKE